MSFHLVIRFNTNEFNNKSNKIDLLNIIGIEINQEKLF